MAKEFQVKVRLDDLSQFNVQVVLDAGGSQQGHFTQSDTYVKVDGTTWRIRKTADGQLTITRKGPNTGSRIRIQVVKNDLISEEEAARITSKGHTLAVICKTRSNYQMPNGTQVCLDDVEHLGSFVEVFGSSEQSVEETLERIHLSETPRICESYLELAMKAPLPVWMRTLMAVHDQVGEFAFGITSGVVTTSGLLLSVAFGVMMNGLETEAKKAVLCAIAGIAVSDSCSDAFGVFMMKSGERGVLRSVALRTALRTFAGKFILPLTYLIPIMLLPLRAAIPIDLVWGTACLAALSAEQALVAHEPVLKMVAIKVGFAVIVMAFGTVTGALIGKWG